MNHEQVATYLKVLKDEFETRLARNSNYSLRAYARDLEFNPARLSEVLGGKKGLSEKAAHLLTHKLGLNKLESELFVLSVKSKCSRSPNAKKEAHKKLVEFKLNNESTYIIDNADFELTQNWYHLALLELIEMPNVDQNPVALANRLALPTNVVISALNRLQQVGLIEKSNGKWRSTQSQTTTTFDIPSKAIKNYHTEILEKAKTSVQQDPIDTREFLSMTMAFSTEKTKEAKEAIRKFQKEFAEKFYPTTEEQDSIYQLSVQFFRLDKKIKQAEEI